MEKLLNAQGELLSIDEVELLANKPVTTMVLAREGVYSFIPAEQNREILINGGDTEDLDEIEDTWLQAISLENYLYQEFLKEKFKDRKLDELMTVVYRDFVDESLLHIQIKMLNPIWTYDYRISLDVEGNVVISEDMFEDQDSYDKAFGMGKYESKISDLEAYEREKYGKK